MARTKQRARRGGSLRPAIERHADSWRPAVERGGDSWRPTIERHVETIFPLSLAAMVGDVTTAHMRKLQRFRVEYPEARAVEKFRKYFQHSEQCKAKREHKAKQRMDQKEYSAKSRGSSEDTEQIAEVGAEATQDDDQMDRDFEKLANKIGSFKLETKAEKREARLVKTEERVDAEKVSSTWDQSSNVKDDLDVDMDELAKAVAEVRLKTKGQAWGKRFGEVRERKRESRGLKQGINAGTAMFARMDSNGVAKSSSRGMQNRPTEKISKSNILDSNTTRSGAYTRSLTKDKQASEELPAQKSGAGVSKKSDTSLTWTALTPATTRTRAGGWDRIQVFEQGDIEPKKPDLSKNPMNPNSIELEPGKMRLADISSVMGAPTSNSTEESQAREMWPANESDTGNCQAGAERCDTDETWEKLDTRDAEKDVLISASRQAVDGARVGKAFSRRWMHDFFCPGIVLKVSKRFEKTSQLNMNNPQWIAYAQVIVRTPGKKHKVA